jgi:hypothetical protein
MSALIGDVIYKPSDYLFHMLYKPSDYYFQMPVEQVADLSRLRRTRTARSPGPLTVAAVVPGHLRAQS